MSARIWKSIGILSALAAMLASPVVKAQVGPPPGTLSPVIYNPNTTQIVSLSAPHYTFSYDLTITAPAVLPLSQPTVVAVNVGLLSSPADYESVALSFVTFSQSTLTFDSANRSRTITVTVTMPSGGVGTTEAFKYRITTAGWPAGYNISDNGTEINASQVPPSGLEGPVVAITSPADQTRYTYTMGGPSVMVPISVTGMATDSAPVDVLTATLTGYAYDAQASVILPTTTLSMVMTGLGTASSGGVVFGGYPVSIPGHYVIEATAVNSQGVSVTTSNFYVDLDVNPPTVQIIDPHSNPAYTYLKGFTSVNVPYTIVADSFVNSGITTLTATLDGTPIVLGTLEGLNTDTANASGSFFYDASVVDGTGLHTLNVTATDINTVTGAVQTATASKTFTVAELLPQITVAINPEIAANSPYTLPSVGSLSIPFTFTGNITPGATVDTISGSLNGTAVTINSYTGLQTSATATGSGTMVITAPGTYTLAATDTNAISGLSATTSVVFVVQQATAQSTPPTVAINTPDDGSTFVLTGSSLTIPMTFTGRSTTPGAVITAMTATLNGSALSWAQVAPNTLGTPVADGSSSLVVTATGTYTIHVTATDAYGTDNDTHTFTVVAANTTATVTGNVFFDVNFNGISNTEDYGIGGVPVKLTRLNGSVAATATTDSNGMYAFSSVTGGTYVVVVSGLTGLSSTTNNEHQISVSVGTCSAPDTGYGLNFGAIRTMSANGFSQGFWKNNVSKNLSKKTSGAQVCLADMLAYTSQISSLALPAFSGMTMTKANTVFNGKNQLELQLLASEYNYASGGFIGNSQTLTYAFIYWGEYVLSNPSKYSSAYITFAKNWFDAYNNSHGGLVSGPNP